MSTQSYRNQPYKNSQAVASMPGTVSEGELLRDRIDALEKRLMTLEAERFMSAEMKNRLRAMRDAPIQTDKTS